MPCQTLVAARTWTTARSSVRSKRDFGAKIIEVLFEQLGDDPLVKIIEVLCETPVEVPQ